MHPDYFEAVLQLRNPRKEVEDHLVSALKGEISKVRKVRGGIDYYVRDKKVAERVGKELTKTYGAEYNVAPKLHTLDRQTSKGLYRLNVLVRLPLYSKNDVIVHDDVLLKVTGLGRKLSGVDLKTGSKKFLEHGDYEMLEKHMTSVVKIVPRLEVLHPETYQAVEIMNPRRLSMGEKVEVVVRNGVWLV